MNQTVRLILAFVLSTAILFVYQIYFMPEAPVPTENPTQIEKKQDEEIKSDLSQTQVAQKTESTITSPKETKAEVKVIEVETGKTKVSLTTQGAQLVGYELKDYHVDVSKEATFRNLLTDTKDSSSLFLGLDGYDQFSDKKVFEIVSDKTLDNGAREILLSWTDGSIEIQKAFSFGKESTSYAVQVAYKIKNLTNHPLQLTPYISSRLHQKEQKKATGLLKYIDMSQKDLFFSYYFKGDSLENNLKWKDFESLNDEGAIAWSGIADRYFLFGLINEKDKAGLEPMKVDFIRQDDFLVNKFSKKSQTVNAGSSLDGQFVAYIGPKKISELELVGAKLDKAVDYGWFSVLAYPILWLMNMLQKVIPNWGLVIITLTFIIKMLLHPVNKKSMSSMKGMQALQPKLKEIKEKHAGDQQKQNEAVMQLFKTHKVNPMSGCLPMFLQMPIYIVLYKVLWNAIELYHAPFFGPYQDLSAPDPYFILPLLLGVFMFLQQKLTPSASADPTQQKMMMIMPIMFTGFMLFLPVGLVVYIFINTFISVVQQYMIKRDIGFRDLLKGRLQPHTNGA